MSVPLLIIPEGEYDEAVRALQTFQQDKLADAYVRKIVRTYVNLGQTKRIFDWSSQLPEQTKRETLSMFLQQAKRLFQLNDLTSGQVEWRLNALELLSKQGRVSNVIAKPRTYQLKWEYDYKQSHKDDKGIIETTFETIAKSLGINIDFKIAGLLVVALLIFLIVK